MSGKDKTASNKSMWSTLEEKGGAHQEEEDDSCQNAPECNQYSRQLLYSLGQAPPCSGKPWHYMTWYWVTAEEWPLHPLRIHIPDPQTQEHCEHSGTGLRGWAGGRVITVSLFAHIALANHRTQYTGFWIRTCTAVKFNKVTHVELPGYLILHVLDTTECGGTPSLRVRLLEPTAIWGPDPHIPASTSDWSQARHRLPSLSQELRSSFLGYSEASWPHSLTAASTIQTAAGTFYCKVTFYF